MTRAFLFLALLTASALHAQGTITGIVRDSTRRPLANAEVVLMDPARSVRTDSAGRFSFAGLSAGTYDVRARRLGYYPASVKVALKGGATKVLAFELDQRAAVLDTVTVSASCPRFSFAGFDCRRRKGIAGQSTGVFADEVQIDSSGARMAGELFWLVPQLKAAGLTRPLPPSVCRVSIVNGKRPSKETNPMPSWAGEVIAIEYYASANDVPPEYSHFVWGQTGTKRRTTTRCALLNYWTSVRLRYPAGAAARKPTP